MVRRLLGPWARQCAAFLLIGLGTSRFALLIHEMAGHGGVVVILGGRITSYHLYLFGGGWIGYCCCSQRGWVSDAAIWLGGIALQIVAGCAAMLVAARIRGRAPLAHLALVGFATADLLHAAFYLAVSTHHGFGDGLLLYDALGAGRAAVVWPAAAAVVIAGLLFARRLALMTGHATGVRTRAGRTVALLSAVIVASLIHGALTWSERALAHDAVYESVMQPESARQPDRELASLEVQARSQATLLDEHSPSATRTEMERRAYYFPLLPMLAVALVVAFAAGAWLGTARPPSAPHLRAALVTNAEAEARIPPVTEDDSEIFSARSLLALGAVCMSAILLVALLRWLK